MADNKSYKFKAEIRQLLDILVHSLYKEREIFLRELISNASDALTRLQFEMLTNRDIVDPEAELAITLETKKPAEGEEGDSWLIIKDTGVGMTAEEMRRNLGTIAQSGAREFLDKLQDGQDGQEGEKSQIPPDADLNEVIGQFGVGFYSVFMAASEVRVVSRSCRPEEEAATWISTGSSSFRIAPAEKEDRGTEIHIKLRPDAHEYADPWHIRQIVKKHSDYVAFPIYLDGEQINERQSIWRKRPADLEEGDYAKFYQQMTMDFEKPLATIHFRSDAPLNVRALLFVPAKREKTMFHRRTEPGVMLYSRNVMIQAYCQDLLPRWLQFIDGVVDSEDLPLNVSRETVQNTRLMRTLAKTIRRPVLREVTKILEDDDKRAPFWQEYGRFFKEGLAVQPEDREDIFPLLRFYSSKSDGKLISLDEYAGRMPEAQTEIYYVLGDDLTSIAHSPHLDPFLARDLEVLYFVDPFDAFMAPALGTFGDKPFRAIDDGQLAMPDVPLKETDEAADAAEPVGEDEWSTLRDRVKAVLGERVTDVRQSTILRSSPARLVSPENEANPHASAMNRVQRFVGHEVEIPPKALELNPKHPLVRSLAALTSGSPDHPAIDLSINQLYEGILVQEGLHPNPAEMLPRIQQLMELLLADS